MEHAQLIEFGWSYFAQLINTVILFLVLKKILFKPVRSFMLNRQEGIANAITDADQRNAEAITLKKQYEEKVMGIEEESREKIKQAVIKAEEQAKIIILEAQNKSADLLKRTEVEIRREKEQAISDFKDQIASLAIFAAEKILEKQLDSQEHHIMVDKIIADAGRMKWQS